MGRWGQGTTFANDYLMKCNFQNMDILFIWWYTYHIRNGTDWIPSNDRLFVIINTNISLTNARQVSGKALGVFSFVYVLIKPTFFSFIVYCLVGGSVNMLLWPTRFHSERSLRNFASCLHISLIPHIIC